MKGYKTVRTQYIDFVKKYNTSKTAGTIIALTPVEQEAMNNLHALWKMASLEKTENGGDYYFDMKDHHDQLQGKFSMLPEDTVCTAWNNYIKGHSDWRQVILMSGATMFQLRL